MRHVSSVLPLLLLLAGCPQTDGTPRASDAPASPARAGTVAAGTSAPAPVAAETSPAATDPAEPIAQDAGGQQGIRVGEPDPNSPRGPRPAPGSGWHAFGNEPFWSVQARGTTLVFATPEDQTGTTLLGRRVPSLVGTVIIGSGTRGDFHFGVTPGKCSDGMSGRSFDYAATFIYGGTTYKGCAEPVGTPPRRAPEARTP